MAHSLAPPGLQREAREHLDQVRVRVTDPLAIRRDPEQMLGHDQTQQLNIVEGGLAAGVTIPRRAESGQDPVIEVDVKCGQEGVEVSFHTQGLTPSVNN